MSKFLLDIALEKGFKLILGKHLDYSTMIPNGISSIYKDSNQNIIIWGLSEAHKPPTLIKPRPNIEKKIKINDHPYINFKSNNPDKLITITQIYDDVMNEALNKFSHEEIFEAMFNKEIILKL